MRKDDGHRLHHLLEAAREAVGYTAGRRREDLETDRPLMHSLVRCLEIMGEAAGVMSPECRDANPQIPWNDVISMRNRLIHAYFDINLDIVWRTVTEELPVVIVALEFFLSSQDGSAP